MPQENENVNKWADPEGTHEGGQGGENPREQFIQTKSETEWTEAAQAAGMSVEEYLNKEYAAQQGTGGEGDQGGEGAGEGQQQQQQQQQQQGQQGQEGQEGQFTPNPLWEELKGVEGFQMPDNLTAENEADLLKQALVDNKLAEAGQAQAGQQQEGQEAQKPIIDDPEVEAYLRYKQINPEATLNDYMQQRTQYSDMLSLSDRDFMVAHYKNEYGVYDEEKNPDGLREEEIEDAVSNMEDNKTLPFEARKLKKEYRSKESSVSNISDEDIQKAQQSRRQDTAKAIQNDAKKLFAETEKITELNGVKLSKADVQEINTAFEKAILPNEQGAIPIAEMLQSDRTLWNFFAVNYLGDEKFKAALFNAKDATKEELYGKLGLKPVNQGGRQTDTGQKNAITPGLWSQPDQNDV